MRQCKKCLELKELDEFYKRKSGNYEWICKKCISDQSKKRRSELKINTKHRQQATIDQIKEMFDKIPNLKLLSNEYTNFKTPLKIQCIKCSHIWEKKLGNIKINKNLCPNCEVRNKKIYWSDVIELFNSYNFEVLTEENEYKCAFHSKIKFECKKCGLVYDISYTALKSKKYPHNNDCQICDSIKNQIPILFSDIKKSFENENWILHTKENEYKNQNETKVICFCPNGHKQIKSIRKWRNGRRCQYCITSGPELEIKQFLENNNIFVKYNDRKILKGQEIDFLLNDKAIEFNGDYWHCNPKFYDKEYLNKHKNLTAEEIWKKDLEKKIMCEKNNINLLVIWEDDWKNKPDITKEKILAHFIS